MTLYMWAFTYKTLKLLFNLILCDMNNNLVDWKEQF